MQIEQIQQKYRDFIACCDKAGITVDLHNDTGTGVSGMWKFNGCHGNISLYTTETNTFRITVENFTEGADLFLDSTDIPQQIIATPVITAIHILSALRLQNQIEE